MWNSGVFSQTYRSQIVGKDSEIIDQTLLANLKGLMTELSDLKLEKEALLESLKPKSVKYVKKADPLQTQDNISEEELPAETQPAVFDEFDEYLF